ncbi:nuclease [Cystobacter fuscus]|uniref:Nuclease n=1 Tax=Cystobacter fuscus TaxID=43 RepID=A0A250JC22_9BACT|nr:VRR-NUC domain-containing protein [Cystobacter fuscus]ATB41153.1 nuclease [Cystobacter fuscus]
MRYAAQRDKAEPAVVRALQLTGWTVVPVSAPGFPDLLCVRRGVVVLLEVKSKGGRMQPAQVELHARLRVAGLAVAVVTTPEEALAAVRGDVQRTALTEPAKRRGSAGRTLAELATPNTLNPGRRRT